MSSDKASGDRFRSVSVTRRAYADLQAFHAAVLKGGLGKVPAELFPVSEPEGRGAFTVSTALEIALRAARRVLELEEVDQ